LVCEIKVSFPYKSFALCAFGFWLLVTVISDSDSLLVTGYWLLVIGVLVIGF